MIVTELYNGQGIGNQLACYVTTRVIALNRGLDFGIMSPHKFKGLDCFDLDFGKEVIGGSGPEGGPPTTLPETITNYYLEKTILHPTNGSNLSCYDDALVSVPDNTKIDGLMQGEEYIKTRREEVKQWLTVKPEFDCYDYSDENTCVINFRGGEYTRHPEFFLTQSYWDNAIKHMRSINKNFRFIVISDDPLTAKKFFPDFGVFHFNIGKDYSIIKNAHYLILSNTTFAWFPAWTSTVLKFCIAPKYFARHNISDGYWSLGTNLTSGWHYLDREGNLCDYETCLQEFTDYKKSHPEIYEQQNSSTILPTSPKPPKELKDLLKKHTPLWIKNIIKSLINETKNLVSKIRLPYDLYVEKKRKQQWLSNLELIEYRKKIKVYDLFLFFNELDLLEIRLNILDSYVDYFVIIESTETFTGTPKKLFYEENKERFKKWEHKIIHYVVTDTPRGEQDLRQRLLQTDLSTLDREIIESTLTAESVPDKSEVQWLKEYFQKESGKKALVGLSDDDICYISDLDEIWNPELVIDYSRDDLFKYKQVAYVYYLNNRSNEDWSGWVGTIATKFKNIKTGSLNGLRNLPIKKYTVIKNGGWHFTFQGGADMIRKKLEAYSHQEINTPEIKSDIENKMLEGKDIRGRYIRFWIDEEYLPTYLKEHKEEYSNLFR